MGIRPGAAPRLAPLLTLVIGAMAVPGIARPQGDVPPNTLPDHYITVLNWAKLPDGRALGETAGIDVAPDGTIWVADPCGGVDCTGSDLDPILRFDPSGRLLDSFGAGRFAEPHGLHVDPDGNVWVTDIGLDPAPPRGQQVLKFSPDGDLLLELGTAGLAGRGPYLFDQPSDVLVGPDGDIFVADGHGPDSHARIVRYDAAGAFLLSWGRHGAGPDGLETPHGLAMDSRHRLFVADRSNNRVQVFDREGTLLESWTQFGRPSGLFIDPWDRLFVADSESTTNEGGYGHNPNVRRGIRIGSARDGRVTAFIPDPAERGVTSGAEGVAVDPDGAVYAAEAGPRDVKKYIPR